MSAETVQNPLCRSYGMILITLIHIFLGNMLMTHNISVYVPDITTLPRFDYFSLNLLCYIILMLLKVPKGRRASAVHLALSNHRSTRILAVQQIQYLC